MGERGAVLPQGLLRSNAISLCRVLLVLSCLFPDSSAIAQPLLRYSPDTILVRFKASARPEDKALAHTLVGAYAHKNFTLVDGLHAVKLPAGMDVKEALAQIGRAHV